MSGVPSPRVRKPKPRSRLNHLTCARSSPLVGVTVTCVRGGTCDGWIAVDSSMDRRRKACRPLQHLADDPRALVSRLEPVTPQAGDVQQHVGQAVVGNDEPEAFGNVE